jgi:pyridoxamine 5'-phosphate oxidase-like protein
VANAPKAEVDQQRLLLSTKLALAVLRYRARALSGLFSARQSPMILSMMYHDGNRRLQDRFDSRRISDRLEEKLTRTEFTADHKAFIEGASYFFLATADAQGRPDCSYKGGMPGFVRVAGPKELAFPDYDYTSRSG